MLVDPEAFADQALARIYIAGRLSEAKRVESALSERGIDYTVEIERFRTHLLGIIPTEYEGVAFYVPSAQAELCRRILDEADLHTGLVED